MGAYFIGADIGGTKVLLQAAQSVEGGIRVCCERRYPSRDYPDFSRMLADFLREVASTGLPDVPVSACFAVAGPIARQQVRLTNLPWVMDGAAISSEFSIPAVSLINDFKAVALGIGILSADDLATLQPGRPEARGTGVVLGAGTGMGGAWLVWQGDRHVPLPSEAGHMDFAPGNALQDELLQYLRARFGHVSVERLLSGPGLVNIFDFIVDRHGTDASMIAQAGDGTHQGPAQVTDLALNHRHPLALEALDLFVRIYGAYAGNLALAALSRGGVYVAGGIAPRIVGQLREGGFIEAFRDKGRFSGLMEEIPVHVVTNPKVGLLGAMREAQRLAREAGRAV